MRRVAVVVVGALLLFACASAVNGPPPTFERARDPGRWGPLAVVDVPNRPAALIRGTLEVTDRCVFLIERGERVLLVWPADETEWDAVTRSVVFRELEGRVVTLRSGQQLSLGGGSFIGDEGERPGPEGANQTGWVNPPDPECVTEHRWFVSGGDVDK